MIVNGMAMPLGVIVRHVEAHDIYYRSTGAMLLAAMSLPIQDLASVGWSIAGCSLTPPHDALVVTPTPSAIARLWRLHAAAGRLAEEAPEVLANPDAARGLEQELIQAMVACLSTADVRENRSAQRRHDRIMRRFHAVLEENIGCALYVPDLCAAIGVPERTLRTCCLERLGMAPKEYLRLRRMNLARHDLREADPAVTTVTDMAMRYGSGNSDDLRSNTGAYSVSRHPPRCTAQLSTAALGLTPVFLRAAIAPGARRERIFLAAVSRNCIARKPRRVEDLRAWWCPMPPLLDPKHPRPTDFPTPRSAVSCNRRTRGEDHQHKNQFK